MRLPRSLSEAVGFALWCRRERQEPAAVARLLVLARRHKLAWERSTQDSSTSSRYLEQSERWGDEFERAAAAMGYTTDWPGLWPVLRRHGRDVYLPEIA